MARKDAHSPTNLITEDYTYLFAADNSGPWALGLNSTPEGQAFLKELANYDPATADRGNSQCHHCGAHLRYVAWLRHTPTGYTICVGETCLENRFERATVDFQRLRKQAQLDREKQAILLSYNAWVRSAADRRAFLLLCSDADFETAAQEAGEDKAPVIRLYREARADSFVSDVRAKCRKYGFGTDNQVAAVVKVPARIAQRRDQQAVEANEVAVPVPTGKQTIEGTVLTTKWQESQYGGALKMLVKVTTPQGVYKVWGTVPRSIDVKKGDTVRFTATFERSRDDDAFGFYKRPTQARITAVASAAPVAPAPETD